MMQNVPSLKQMEVEKLVVPWDNAECGRTRQLPDKLSIIMQSRKKCHPARQHNRFALSGICPGSTNTWCRQDRRGPDKEVAHTLLERNHSHDSLHESEVPGHRQAAHAPEQVLSSTAWGSTLGGRCHVGWGERLREAVHCSLHPLLQQFIGA